jgi:transcriptional regulator with XRE-family HTH domain
MDTDICKKLAKRIKSLRKKCGLTQEKLAEISGIDYKHVQLLESQNPSAAKIDTLEKLAKAFKISPSELIKFK